MKRLVGKLLLVFLAGTSAFACADDAEEISSLLLDPVLTRVTPCRVSAVIWHMSAQQRLEGHPEQVILKTVAVDDDQQAEFAPYLHEFMQVPMAEVAQWISRGQGRCIAHYTGLPETPVMQCYKTWQLPFNNDLYGPHRPGKKPEVDLNASELGYLRCLKMTLSQTGGSVDDQGQ